MKIITKEELVNLANDTKTYISNIEKDKSSLLNLNSELLSCWTGEDGKAFTEYLEKYISAFDLYLEALDRNNNNMVNVNEHFETVDENLSTPIL